MDGRFGGEEMVWYNGRMRYTVARSRVGLPYVYCRAFILTQVCKGSWPNHVNQYIVLFFSSQHVGQLNHVSAGHTSLCCPAALNTRVTHCMMTVCSSQRGKSHMSSQWKPLDPGGLYPGSTMPTIS
jgi:hypothetical protein